MRVWGGEGVRVWRGEGVRVCVRSECEDGRPITFTVPLHTHTHSPSQDGYLVVCND